MPSIFGGKLTTYRKRAEHATERLDPKLPFDAGGAGPRAPLPDDIVWPRTKRGLRLTAGRIAASDDPLGRGMAEPDVAVAGPWAARGRQA